MNDIREALDNISTNFIEMNKDHIYMKQKITDFYKTNRIKIDFNYCHIAMSKNGGLIAICKKKNFLDTSVNSKLNNYVIVMFQNAKNIYNIKIDWNYNKRWIVCLDFTEKQELYGILNDGGLFKFKYIERIKKEKVTCPKLKEEGIINAKLFRKGFIAYTNMETFRYVSDIKNQSSIVLCEVGIIKLSQNIDFLPISDENSESKRIELLIKNENGNGVLHIVQKIGDEKFQLNLKDDKKMEVVGLNLILKGSPQPFIMENSEGKKDAKKKKEGDFPDGLGKIDALAISPSGKTVAFYNSQNKIGFIMKSTFDGVYQTIYFNHNEADFSKKENDEIKAVLEFKRGNQFLFCGEDTLVITGQRFVILSRANVGHAMPILIKEGSEILAIQGVLFSRCVSEIDGLRCLTSDGIYFIKKITKEFYDIFFPFSEANTRKLMKIYQKAFTTKYNSHKEVKALNYLSDIVRELQLVAANIFWREKENDEQYKEIQLFLLKVAQYGKYFVDKDSFNFDKFNTICKDIRIINQLRNNEDNPLLITYEEYLTMNVPDIIDILIRYKDFKSAAQISKYLEYGTKKTLYKYMIERMKKQLKLAEKYRLSSLKEKNNENEEEEIYKQLLKDIEQMQDISYVNLAKKAIKYGSEKFAMKLLDQEKSTLTKIPQLIELNKAINSLNICFDTYDFNIVSIVIKKISEKSNIDKNLDEKKFMEYICMPELQEHHSKIILFLKRYRPNLLESFLLKTKNYNEYLYLKLEEFYNSEKFEKKKKIIEEIKKEIKNYDPKNVKYIESLEKSLKFKKSCMDDNIIHYSEVEPFKKTINDCIVSGYQKEKANWIESQNKNLEYSNKKLYIIKFRSYLEKRRPDAIDAQLEKTSLKKLGLTPLNMAEIYYDYKNYEKATEYLLQVKEREYFSYIIELYKSMNKYEEALEMIISDKENENKGLMVNEILRKEPKLKYYVDELCVKYKVYLG